MAASAVLHAMSGGRTLHPFFTGSKGAQQTNGAPPENDAEELPAAPQLDGPVDEPPKHRAEDKWRDPIQSHAAKTQRTLQDVVNSSSAQAGEQNRRAEVPDSESSDAIFTSPISHKRRRLNWSDDVEDEEVAEDTRPDSRVNGTHQRQRSPRVVIVTESSPLGAVPAAGTGTGTGAQTPPKKMLRLNASGKFSSPVSRKAEGGEDSSELPKRRGRPRKVKDTDQGKRLVVVMAYSTTDAVLGSRIDGILSGQERLEAPVSSSPKKQRTPRKQKLSKSTHPFFLGKPKEALAPTAKQDSPRKASAVTPGKLRAETMANRPPSKQSSKLPQDFVLGSGLLKDRLMFKHPGAKEPAWPDREQSHVRGLSSSDMPHANSSSSLPLNKRKRKAADVPFPGEESILKRFGAALSPEVTGASRDDGFREPHPRLTLPERLLISGMEITDLVSLELDCTFADPQSIEFAPATSQSSSPHPALQSLYDRLPNTFSALDEGRGECLSWQQKYEPATTVQVLQPVREMNVLKDWLLSLTVTAVVGGSGNIHKPVAKLDQKPKKKRRRRREEMDDFLVSDDEDIHDMDELTDPEEVHLPISTGQKVARSVVQAASIGTKLSNAVLLSGPSGCGKTAAAHAVAKELGFKIFEISPCERRSGKDVVDRVGDMTENHLVKHHGVDVGEMSSTEDPSRNEEAFQRDLASGRQGTMNAFFQPKSKPKRQSPKKTAKKGAVIEALKAATKKPPKDQQQSLILLEEVDTLFKDDKDFWSTVLRLIESSKRPFIMTCNNEDLVPLQAMSLHAILRFTAPAVTLATDYLLLMAASEGHLLRRDAVTSLYRMNDCDLRASITELNFWCQMGIGDPRGGLSWIFQRYPPGCDLDVNGQRVRVVSKGTYEASMSLSLDPSLGIETELSLARREAGIEYVDILRWNEDSCTASLSLKQLSSVADAFSAIDVYATHSDRTQLDTSQPAITEKGRSQYIEGMRLLQTDLRADHAGLCHQLGIAATLAACESANLMADSTLHERVRGAALSPPPNPGLETSLTRQDFTCFDAISVNTDSTPPMGPGLSQSAFDGPLNQITTDLAPYVRSIVQYDQALAEQRERLDSILSDGRQPKRPRTTRAARSAVEGSQRANTRRERWFPKDLDVKAVLATAGLGWPRTTALTTTASTDEVSENASVSDLFASHGESREVSN